MAVYEWNSVILVHAFSGLDRLRGYRYRIFEPRDLELGTLTIPLPLLQNFFTNREHRMQRLGHQKVPAVALSRESRR
jgi:hypothetical protein